MTGDREYLRAAEIAALTGMSLRTIRRWIAEEILPSTKLGGARSGRYREAVEILDGLVLTEDFAPFLTIPAYAYLD